VFASPADGFGFRPSRPVPSHWEYVDHLLKGDRAGDLPVKGPAEFDLVINLKAARGLGIAVSPSLLGIANQVIEQPFRRAAFYGGKAPLWVKKLPRGQTKGAAALPVTTDRRSEGWGGSCGPRTANIRP